MYNILTHYYKCVGLFRHMIILPLDIYTYSIGLLKMSTSHDRKSFFYQDLVGDRVGLWKR